MPTLKYGELRVEYQLRHVVIVRLGALGSSRVSISGRRPLTRMSPHLSLDCGTTADQARRLAPCTGIKGRRFKSGRPNQNTRPLITTTAQVSGHADRARARAAIARRSSLEPRRITVKGGACGAVTS
jgi:hypothetical protein